MRAASHVLLCLSAAAAASVVAGYNTVSRFVVATGVEMEQ